MSKPDFTDVNKTAAKNFNNQRDIIKDLCRGKMVTCPECNKPLEMIGPSKKSGSKTPGIYCKKGCTAIELEFQE
jgi:hypothetical protein